MNIEEENDITEKDESTVEKTVEIKPPTFRDSNNKTYFIKYMPEMQNLCLCARTYNKKYKEFGIQLCLFKSLKHINEKCKVLGDVHELVEKINIEESTSDTKEGITEKIENLANSNNWIGYY